MSETARRWIGNLVTVAVIAALFVGVYQLPPDTSLAEVRQRGFVRVCLPFDYPPLVTLGTQAQRGFEVELLEAALARIGLRMMLNPNTVIGRTLNPRDWHLNRAACEVIAGGVVATTLTRSFLDTTPAHLETGWVFVGPEVPASLAGMTVGFFAGLSGRDQIALSQYLRQAGATVRPVASRAALVQGLAAGTFDGAVTEALVGRSIAGTNGWEVAWLPEPLHRDPVAFGLWKGDLTLKRALRAALDDLRDEGFVAALAERYGIAPVERTIGG